MKRGFASPHSFPRETAGDPLGPGAGSTGEGSTPRWPCCSHAAAHAGGSALCSLRPLASSFPISAALFPFQEGLVSELFWGRHEAAILGSSLGWGRWAQSTHPLPGQGLQGSHPEPSASTSPFGPSPFTPSSTIWDRHLKARIGELVACLLEPERPGEQRPLHTSSHSPLCL